MSEMDLNERVTQAALAGRASGPEVTKERAREVIEKRVHACIHATGQTPAALAQNDPERYHLWLAGNARALVREGLKVTGELDAKGLRWLESRERRHRNGVDVDAVNDEFEDMFDTGERDPRLTPASRDFLDREDETESS